jgi:hypothetical protein
MEQSLTERTLKIAEERREAKVGNRAEVRRLKS